ncbi:hypothetical protein THS5294_00123 [Thalassobacter stenotrophicus]|uniref:Uncharacterized protein n=1 Tax=Thalassobacter stenotrophicus TaxID=266809 RepID=A0A0P1EV61_9RHOB|nr:hypothetical protein THS5294_00123 [Thalassobacter stenotrophicus]
MSGMRTLTEYYTFGIQGLLVAYFSGSGAT